MVLPFLILLVFCSGISSLIALWNSYAIQNTVRQGGGEGGGGKEKTEREREREEGREGERGVCIMCETSVCNNKDDDGHGYNCFHLPSDVLSPTRGQCSCSNET